MSQGGGGGGGGDPDKDSYMLLWMMGVIIILGWVVWHFWGNYLRIAFIAVKKYEVLAVSFFIENENISRALQGLNMVRQDSLSMYYAGVISKFVGGYLMYPICFILLVMAIIMFRGHATMRYTKAYNMDTLVQQEKENYPQICPVADIDLVSQDVNEGPWAMAQNPMQFARHEKLLKVELVPDRKSAWKGEGIPKATVIREKATQIFANQLGPLWSGVDNLPPHTKALYAAFLARIEHDTDACRGYLIKLSKSASTGTMVYEDTEALLKKYGQSKAAVRCHAKHAYVLTMMMSILQLGRTDGVLASSDFLWIKPLDRRLWYVLNNVGRQVVMSEVGGIHAHWLAEKEMGRALTVPIVDEAVNALEKAMANMVYIPEENEHIAPAILN